MYVFHMYTTPRHEIQHYLKKEKSEKITKNNTIIHGATLLRLRIQMKVMGFSTNDIVQQNEKTK